MGPYPHLECQNPLKKRRPPRGRVARVMDRARTHTPTHTPTGLAVAPVLQSCNLAGVQGSQQISTGYGMGSNVESK